jgi:hypothetical protein
VSDPPGSGGRSPAASWRGGAHAPAASRRLALPTPGDSGGTNRRPSCEATTRTARTVTGTCSTCLAVARHQFGRKVHVWTGVNTPWNERSPQRSPSAPELRGADQGRKMRTSRPGEVIRFVRSPRPNTSAVTGEVVASNAQGCAAAEVMTHASVVVSDLDCGRGPSGGPGQIF